MQDIRISLITATYNAESTIRRCIESVIAQNYTNLEYIVIDGGSTDNTLQIISQYRDKIDIFMSGPDDGVYDAMNKGIKIAHGEVVGTLNSDDFFAGNDILLTISEAFVNSDAKIVYGNLDYVKPDETITRQWRTKAYSDGLFNWGWMPPHPTFYCRRELFDQFGLFSLAYGTAADYELMLRFMHRYKVDALFLNKVIIKMQWGGLSNKNPKNRIRAWKFDLKAMRKNGINYPLLTLFMKPLRKLGQYL